jgi:hypothetical protein
MALSGTADGKVRFSFPAYHIVVDMRDVMTLSRSQPLA